MRWRSLALAFAGLPMLCQAASETVMPYVFVGSQIETVLKLNNDLGAPVRGLVEVFSDSGIPIPAFKGSSVTQVEIPIGLYELKISMGGPAIAGWGHLIILEYLQKGKWRSFASRMPIEGTVTVIGPSRGAIKTTTNRLIQVNAAAEFVDPTDTENIFGEHQTVRLINPEREGMSVLMCGCEFAQCNAGTARGCYNKSIPARSAVDINALSVRDSHFRNAAQMYSRYTGRFAAIPLLWADSDSNIKFDEPQ
jgi:hypothetical protein